MSISLEVDPDKPVDRYGRCLAWLWAEDGQGDSRLVNLDLIHGGFALIYPSEEAKRYLSWEGM